MDASPSHHDDAARLRALFKEKATLSQLAFGQRYGLGTQSMISQYLLGRRPLNIDAAMKFADGLGCTINDISPSLAQKIDKARHYVVSSDTDSLPAAWYAASAEAREVARYVLSDINALQPEWVTSDLRHAVGSLLYAALCWLREGEARKKIAA